MERPEGVWTSDLRQDFSCFFSCFLISRTLRAASVTLLSRILPSAGKKWRDQKSGE